MNSINRARRIAAIAVLTIGALGARAMADDVWIKSESVEIRSGKGAVYPSVATVKKGAKVTVVAHEGKWLKVTAGDATGYLYESAISTDKVDGGGNILAHLTDGSSAGDMSTGAAGKGLTEDTTDYASTNQLDPSLLANLIAFRRKIDPAAWEQFTADGKVGPNAPSNDSSAAPAPEAPAQAPAPDQTPAPAPAPAPAAQ